MPTTEQRRADCPLSLYFYNAWMVIAISHYADLLPALLRGAFTTIETFILSAVFAFMIAFVAGLGRLSGNVFIQKAAAVYVEVFRGTSLLVQMFWFYFVLPFFGLELSALAAGVAALALNSGAYASEVVRCSVLAIPKGQTEAAVALNMTPRQRMRRIILPQALKLMLPGFCNISIELLKGTALVSLITLKDLTFQAMSLRSLYVGQTKEIFIMLLILYFILALPLVLLSRWLERRISVGGA